MAILGIIGGIAPASTMDYYRLLVAAYREERPDAYPSIVINSVDLARLLALVGAGRLDELADWLAVEIERLARAGADAALLASNTPHAIYDELARRARIPLLSIVEAAAEATARLGVRTAGLLGTRYTMRGDFYPAVFARHGIAVRAPVPDDLDWVHERYVGELVAGIFDPATREGVIDVVERLRLAGAEAVLLAGTELPLLLRDGPPPGLPLVDTTEAHVRRALRVLLDGA